MHFGAMVNAKMHQNAQICTLQLKFFPGAMAPEPPILGRGYGAPPQTHPLALRRCVPSAPHSGPQASPLTFVSR